MNYDRVIIELLDRISLLEEKTEQLEKIIKEQTILNTTKSEGTETKTRDKTKILYNMKLNWNAVKLPVLNTGISWKLKKKVIQILTLGGRRLYYVLNTQSLIFQ